jgi:hypothetical protein
VELELDPDAVETLPLEVFHQRHRLDGPEDGAQVDVTAAQQAVSANNLPSTLQILL